MTEPGDELLRTLRRLQELMPAVRDLDDAGFAGFSGEWQRTAEALKDAVFVPNPGNRNPDRLKFEFAAGAQAIQNMLDIVPHLQRCMVEHYDRFAPLKLLDVGSGTGAGVNLLAQLHSDTMIWSKLDIDAIDYVPWRSRWVATQYPKVRYSVMDSADLPARAWDFVVCSHVIEHLPDPQAMIRDVLRACRGFAFIYCPYNEIELSPGHLSVITEADFEPHRPERIIVQESMAFHGPGRRCIMAIFDCRDR